jgi:mono/diheme cytochrome c family protein
MTLDARAAMPIVAGVTWWVSAALAAGPWIANMRGQGTAMSAAGTSARSVWDKVYSDAQAKRGQATYLRECAPCHGDDLRGSGPAPALGPDDFLFLWENRTVGDLFERIRTRMPPDRPDSLPPEAYRDVVALPSEREHVSCRRKGSRRRCRGASADSHRRETAERPVGTGA